MTGRDHGRSTETPGAGPLHLETNVTQPLDPYTLRQAAARWPQETLNSRAARSFLRSLWEDAEQQPATAPGWAVDLAAQLERDAETGEYAGGHYAADVLRDVARRIRAEAQPATGTELVEYLQGRRRDTLRAIHASAGGTPDYWRWQGHAELSRQLLTRLGADVPQ